ncbi:MAG: tRNA 4-thiouridine(8) synthase ThiI, partial [candidate division WOR-3 bacterium]
MKKAVGLFSGGLDSILAIKLIQEQQIEVIGVFCSSPFFEKTFNVKKIADELNIPLKIIKFGEEYIELIKNPKYGYGKNLNPCIDCHIYMLKQAKKIMEEQKADFVFTGEVLGERPMSQNRQSLKNIERESGLVGILLRPLSAQLLEPTIPEKIGIVDRTKLGSISGRSRKPQLELAKKFNITNIPQPAGGCLLTDKNFCVRLKDAFSHNEDSLADLELLKIGRHFRVENTKIIVGRNEKENTRLKKIKQSDDLILEPLDIAGPVVLIRHYNEDKEILKLAAGICARYCDKKSIAKIKYCDIIIESKPLDESLINRFRII